MKHSAAALALALSAAATPALADGPVIAPGDTLLSISAEGRSSRTPDLAVFSAEVQSNGATAGAALAANAADMNKVIAALKRSGVADKDIQTSNLSLSPVYSNQSYPQANNEPPRIVGYQASNTVTVRQRDLANLGKVIDTLVAAGANQVNGPSFESDNPDTAMDEARIEAMHKARARADLYARAAGLKVLRILAISEGGGYVPQPPVMFARAAMADGGAAPTPVAAGEVSLQVSVSVQFELAPQ